VVAERRWAVAAQAAAERSERKREREERRKREERERGGGRKGSHGLNFPPVAPTGSA
jgi:hypothetical protein